MLTCWRSLFHASRTADSIPTHHARSSHTLSLKCLTSDQRHPSFKQNTEHVHVCRGMYVHTTRCDKHACSLPLSCCTYCMVRTTKDETRARLSPHNVHGALLVYCCAPSAPRPNGRQRARCRRPARCHSLPEFVRVREPRVRQQRHPPHRGPGGRRAELLLLRLRGRLGGGGLWTMLHRVGVSGHHPQWNGERM